MSLKKEFNILYVDDSSPDGTAAKIKQLQEEFSNRIFLEERKGKLGLGTAYLHGFKWAIENQVINYIEENYDTIEKDMNNRNSTSKRKETITDNSKTRKKREELSVSATKSIKKEEVEIVVKFD